MRTIKFRIFNKKIKSYIDIHSSAIMIDELNNLNDNLIVEQFTGLHDKNGKEIYEGDIVSYQSIIQNYEDDDCVNPRYYRTPQYETKTHNCIVKYIGNQFTIMDNSKWNELKIIGNIYENTELLKN